MAELEINYTPSKTVKEFYQSDAKMRVIMGPVGSGKSVGMCFEVLRRAMGQEPGNDGFRRTRFAVVRNTVRQLADTTIKTWLDWFPDGVCGHFMRTTKTYFLELGDIRSEIMFRALDDADDVANLNSLELTGAWFNECRDINEHIVDAMSKRVGRYPSKKDGGPTWHGMWGDTNPPTIDTWWYYQMEHLNPDDGVSPNDNGWIVFKQPSGRSPDAENIEHLPEGYYDIQGRSEEYVRTFIDGEYGHSLAGTPVYKHFQPDFHISKVPLSDVKGSARPIIVGMDMGLTPAAVIGQHDPFGRMLILDELAEYDMGVQRFVRTRLKPLLSEKYPGRKVMIVIDPAGDSRQQGDERTPKQLIEAEGFSVIKASTNKPDIRINAVDDYLMRQVDGKAAFLLDPRCTKLKAAMMGGYRFHPKTGNIEKNPHSHIAEALQYLALHITDFLGQVPVVRRDVKKVSYKAWT